MHDRKARVRTPHSEIHNIHIYVEKNIHEIV